MFSGSMPRSSGRRQASLSPCITSGVSMNPKWKMTRVMPAPTGTSLMRSASSTRGSSTLTEAMSSTRSCRTRLCFRLMGQAKRDPRGRRREDRRRARQPYRRRLDDPLDEFLLALAQSGALLLKQLPPGAPGQHDKCNDTRQQEREPAPLDQLRRIRRNENQLDDKEEAVHRNAQEWVVAPFQGDEGRQHRGDRHQH